MSSINKYTKKPRIMPGLNTVILTIPAYGQLCAMQSNICRDKVEAISVVTPSNVSPPRWACKKYWMDTAHTSHQSARVPHQWQKWSARQAAAYTRASKTEFHVKRAAIYAHVHKGKKTHKSLKTTTCSSARRALLSSKLLRGKKSRRGGLKQLSHTRLAAKTH